MLAADVPMRTSPLRVVQSAYAVASAAELMVAVPAAGVQTLSARRKHCQYVRKIALQVVDQEQPADSSQLTNERG